MRSTRARTSRFGAALIGFSITGAALSSASPPRVQAAASPLPAGTVLYLRLQTAVSTKISKEGQSITATVSRDVAAQGGVAIPVGATLKGTIVKCSQPTTADERAELLMNFTKLTIAGEGDLSITGHLTSVANARESLMADGTVVGVIESETPAVLLSGALAKLSKNSTIADEIQKQRIGQVNTAIEYPVGTDLQFTITEPLAVGKILASSGLATLSLSLRTSLQDLVTDAPQRAVSKDNKPGDPVNLVLVGSAQDIEQAFRNAGWIPAKEEDTQSVADTVRAVINGEGYGAAPVSNLYLFGRKEDFAFEKMLNTFNKRHHLRLWQTSVRAPDGRPIWLGAATHDTGIDIHPGVVSHATDPDLDDERSQVEADLVASGDVRAVQLISRPNPLTNGMTATGGAWHTDGRLLAVDLKAEGAQAKAGSRE
ncbi:MAG TPA: LssY C-terminal domain-containing protein [Terriglobia bacterium]|nr:LssY C-terminal domain-containing protein [Terriglobia bacterium]